MLDEKDDEKYDIIKEFNSSIIVSTEAYNPISSIIQETITKKPEKSKKCLSSGSISGSVTNLCNATLGAGVLSLPYAISKSGIIAGVLLLLLGAMCTEFSITLLVEAMHTSNYKSYEEMTFSFYGRPFLLLVEGCILVFCLGTNTAYIIAVGDMLNQTVLSYFDIQMLNRTTCMVLFWCCIMFPVSLCQKINSLRYASFLSTFVTYNLIVAIIYHSISHPNSNENDLKLWPDSIQDVFLSCPIIMFAFANQINVCQVYNELSTKTPYTMSIVSKYSVLLCFLAYTLTSLFGYIDFSNQVNQDILNNYCLAHDPDLFVFGSAVSFVVFGITLSFPFNVLPCRITLDAILKRISNQVENESDVTGDTADLSELLLPNASSVEELSNSTNEQLLPPIRNFILTLFLSGLALSFAILIPNISILFGLMGGSASACICFIMPSLFYLKTHGFNFENRSELVRYCCVWCLLVGGFVIGVLGTAVTIYSLIYAESEDDICN